MKKVIWNGMNAGLSASTELLTVFNKWCHGVGEPMLIKMTDTWFCIAIDEEHEGLWSRFQDALEIAQHIREAKSN